MWNKRKSIPCAYTYDTCKIITKLRMNMYTHVYMWMHCGIMAPAIICRWNAGARLATGHGLVSHPFLQAHSTPWWQARHIYHTRRVHALPSCPFAAAFYVHGRRGHSVLVHLHPDNHICKRFCNATHLPRKTMQPKLSALLQVGVFPNAYSIYGSDLDKLCRRADLSRSSTIHCRVINIMYVSHSVGKRNCSRKPCGIKSNI